MGRLYRLAVLLWLALAVAVQGRELKLPQDPAGEQQADPVILQFYTALGRNGTRVDNRLLKELIRYTRLPYTGKWTTGPEHNSDRNLEKHFRKHRQDFPHPPATAAEYLQRALAFAHRADDRVRYYVDTHERYLAVVKWDPQTREFLVPRLNGQIATYFLRPSLTPNRFLLIPPKLYRN